MDKDKIENEYTQEIVCPFCGIEYSDSWEYEGGKEDLGLIECYECGKHFYANRQTEITYCTEKAKYGTCASCKIEDTVLTEYNSSIGHYKDLCIKCGEKEKDYLFKKYIKNIKESEDINGD